MKPGGRWREWGVRPFPSPERHLLGNRKGKPKEKTRVNSYCSLLWARAVARWTCLPHWDSGCDRLTVSLLNLWELLLGIAFEPPVQAVPTAGLAHCRDTKDASSGLTAHCQNKQKKPVLPRAFSITSKKPGPRYRKEAIWPSFYFA